MKKIEEIFNVISNLKISELVQLVKLLENTWNISVESHRTDPNNSIKDKKYDISLISVGQNKINVIKEIRSLLTLGLKESKDFVDSVPKLIKSQIDKPEIEVIKNKLESLGAIVNIK
ncbi:MAG: ribosomal protein bL12 [Candidatus Hodgkinia cicadicola]